MQRVATPLKAMGARITTSDGYAPIVLDPAAALHGLPGPFEVGSAQVKSAILLAALQARGPTCISQPLPSRDHTERMLRAMGVAVECDGDHIVLVGPALPLSVDVDVCGDISAAAFFVVAASLVAGSDVRLERVGLNPTRSGFLSILSRMGADLEVVEEGHSGGEPFGSIRVRSADLRATDITAEEVPAAIDELPVLMVAAAGAEGVTRISGAAELRMKESDRISTMAALLGGLGIGVAEHADGLEIRGGKLEGGSVATAGDHRVVMSAAVAALVCNGSVDIEDPGSAAVSYPEFFEHLDKLRS